MPRIRILTSIAAADWAFAAGEVVDESHEHFAKVLPLTFGPHAVLIDDVRGEQTTAPAAPERAVSRRKR